MRAASYIGRVGGLAVALGVGTAIATGHGVAEAQTDSSTSTGASTDGGSTTGTTGSTTQPVTGTSSPSATTSGTLETGEVSAQTGTPTTGTSDGTVETPEVTAESEEPAEKIDEVIGKGGEPTTKSDEPAEDPTQESLDVTDGQSPGSNHAEVQAVGTGTVTGDVATVSPTTTVPVASAGTVQSVISSSSSENMSAGDVAVFADARTLAADGPINVSPKMSALTVMPMTQTSPPAAAPDLLTAAVNLVSSVVNSVLSPLAAPSPTAPAQGPFIWSLLAFARREFDNVVSALGGGAAALGTGATALSTGAAQNVMLAATQMASLALPVPPTLPRPLFPTVGQQLSPSTNFVDWVTGNYPPNNTQFYYGVTGTDVGVIWDNGMVDNPATPYNEHQVLMAFGDTFGIRGTPGDGWRPNILFRSDDATLSNGISLTAPQWFTGNDFGGSPLTYVPTGQPYQYYARQIIFPDGLPAGITLIPTAGISVPTPGTEYGVTQYISFMSVTQWGAPGQWTTNYSAIATSEDNGEVWKVAPQTVRYNQPWTGNQNFQQSAFVRPGDGYVYAYGTPNGRQGAAYVSRVPQANILDLTKYEYYSAGNPGFFGWGATPAGWYKNNPGAATPVFGQGGGACGVANPGNQVSEMSVQYNKTLKKYVVLYGDQFNNIVMRTADRPEGAWSTAKVLMGQQNGGIYAPMMHPWSPSTMGTGNDLYWNLSLWSEYDVMLMRTDLTKV